MALVTLFFMTKMRITDLNRQRNIGSNSMLLEIGPFKIVADAGLSPKEAGLKAAPQFGLLEDFSVDLILLTHCHLDHIGALPVLYRRQSQARILTSIPSQVLGPRMLRNSINVMRRQRDELNIPEYPLYTKGEIQQVEDAMIPLQYGVPRIFYAHDDEIEITFFQAGHIAGAAGVRLVYKHRSIFLTGDVLFHEQLILPAADFPDEKVDTLIMETTKGANPAPTGITRQSEGERLIETISETIGRGGSVLIPSFALGRMQEMLTLLNDAKRGGKLPECPVYCTGLGLDLVDYFDGISRKTGLVHFRRAVLRELGVNKLKYLPEPGNSMSEPSIFVVSSGMLVENTPSYAVAAMLLGDPANAICFVGYCDPDTPGGRLRATKKGDVFTFEAKDYNAEVKADVLGFDFSGHAEREELMEFAQRLNPRAIVLTHGDPDARDWFDEQLAMDAPEIKVVDPQPGISEQV